MMRKLAFTLLAVLSVMSVVAQEMTLEVTNRLKRVRTNEIVEVDYKKVYEKLGIEKGTTVVVLDANGKEVTSQITRANRVIFLVASINGSEMQKYTIKAGIPAQAESKTFGRLITERMDDYAWENDQVAFRVYGMKLKATDGPSNGVDIWMKRVPQLIIDKWYRLQEVEKKDYHSDRGEGLDCYKVGRTLGGGMPAPFTDDKLWLGENFVSAKTVDNGPLRTTVHLRYNPVMVNGKEVSEIREISLDAYSNFSRMRVTFGKKEEFAEMPFAAGLTKHEGKGTSTMDDKLCFVSYWEDMGMSKDDKKKDVANGQLGVAVIMPRKLWVKNADQDNHLLSIGKCESGKASTYYFGFGWSKYGYANEKAWTDAVRAKAEEINSFLKVEIKE